MKNATFLRVTTLICLCAFLCLAAFAAPPGNNDPLVPLPIVNYEVRYGDNEMKTIPAASPLEAAQIAVERYGASNVQSISNPDYVTTAWTPRWPSNERRRATKKVWTNRTSQRYDYFAVPPDRQYHNPEPTAENRKILLRQ